MAYNAPLPKGWLGLPGGELEVGCFMFNKTLTPLDFVIAEKAGSYVNATAGNIYCPTATAANASAKTTATKKKPVKVVA